MENIISAIINKLLDQRKDLVYELRGLDPHLQNYTIKKQDLSQEISPKNGISHRARKKIRRKITLKNVNVSEVNCEI